MRERVAHLKPLLEQALAKIEELSVARTSQNSSMSPSQDLKRKTGSSPFFQERDLGGGQSIHQYSLPNSLKPPLKTYQSRYFSSFRNLIRRVQAVISVIQEIN